MQSKSVRLRLIREDDEDFLRKIRNDNRKYFFDSRYINKEEHHRWFTTELSRKDRLSFVIIMEDFPIGTISLLRKQELGRFIILRNHRHSGYGKKVLQKFKRICRRLGMTKITLYASQKNAKAVYLYLNNGFEIKSYWMGKLKMVCNL